ncbi:MAG: hypothetical protein J0H64_02675 [Actinobacteria bacterium]|nr:hypothetical protein [Actinomycetota bacterium]
MASWILLAVPIVLLLIGLAIWRFIAAVRKSRLTGTGEPVVKLTYTVAVIWAAGCAIGAVIAVLGTLVPAQVGITFPVMDFWPKLPDELRIEGPSATLESGGFTTAVGVVTGLSLPVRICWAISQALDALVPGAIAAFIAVACAQLLKGRAFTEVVSRMAMVTAVIVAVGGFAAQVLGDVAGTMAAHEVLQMTGASWNNTNPDASVDDWWPRPGFNLSLPFWPLAAGLGFAALAAIFRYGSRVQRDTEGLV